MWTSDVNTAGANTMSAPKMYPRACRSDRSRDRSLRVRLEGGVHIKAQLGDPRGRAGYTNKDANLMNTSSTALCLLPAQRARAL